MSKSGKSFLLVAVGSVGDVYPYFGIGSALLERGHSVRILANPYYEASIRKHGLEFLPLGTLADQEEVLHHRSAWSRLWSWEVWVDIAAVRPMRQLFETIAENYVPGSTVVAGSWGGIGARIAQEKLGIPMASLHLEPDRFWSVYDTGVLPLPRTFSSWHPPAFKKFQFRLADRYVDLRFSAVNTFRKELGLEKTRGLLHHWWNSPQRVIALFPEWWGAKQPDWPPQTIVTGFPLWDEIEQQPLSAEAKSFLEEDESPIVFSPGAVNLQARKFLEAAAKSCSILGRRGIILTKYAQMVPENLPPGVQYFDYLPFSSLLPQAAALVHHGGIGTSGQALAAGVPQVTIPMMHSNIDSATRLERLGTAIKIDKRKLNPSLLAESLEYVIGSSEVLERCNYYKGIMDQEIKEGERFSRSIEKTCDLLEDLIGTEASAK